MVEEDEPGLRERAPEVAAFVAHYFDRLKEASKLFRSRHMMTALSLFDQVWFGTHSFGFGGVGCPGDSCSFCEVALCPWAAQPLTLGIA